MAWLLASSPFCSTGSAETFKTSLNILATSRSRRDCEATSARLALESGWRKQRRLILFQSFLRRPLRTPKVDARTWHLAICNTSGSFLRVRTGHAKSGATHRQTRTARTAKTAPAADWLSCSGRKFAPVAGSHMQFKLPDIPSNGLASSGRKATASCIVMLPRAGRKARHLEQSRAACAGFSQISWNYNFWERKAEVWVQACQSHPKQSCIRTPVQALRLGCWAIHVCGLLGYTDIIGRTELD